jgi:hypothetical protein
MNIKKQKNNKTFQKDKMNNIEKNIKAILEFMNSFENGIKNLINNKT